MLSRLAIITNTQLPEHNRREDEKVAHYLSKDFDVEIIDILDNEIDRHGHNRFYIGNIWADVESLEELHAFEEKSETNLSKISVAPLQTYNPIPKTEWSKRYLLDLFRHGYPVIPSISSVDDLNNLGACDQYYIKPLRSWSGIGNYTATAEQLRENPPIDCIIQPYETFVAEVSFFMVDNECIYALRTKSPDERWDLEEFIPTSEQVVFARKFAQYKNEPFQRVDAIEKSDGTLLLTEMEWNGAYKSFVCMQEATIIRFVEALWKSIPHHLF